MCLCTSTTHSGEHKLTCITIWYSVKPSEAVYYSECASTIIGVFLDWDMQTLSIYQNAKATNSNLSNQEPGINTRRIWSPDKPNMKLPVLHLKHLKVSTDE